MRPLRTVSYLALVLSASLLPSGRVMAEDTKGKWQFGFGLSYFATADYIRSNADIALAQQVVGTGGNVLPPVQFVDERPDINIMNQASIRDDFKLDFKASYGLTRWLAIEAAASYMNAPVGNIEFYTKNSHQGIAGQTDTFLKNCGPDPFNPSDCWAWTPLSSDDVKTNTFLPVGTITEIPVNLSGLIRFRPESPLDPYIGLGFGYIIANLKTGDEFNRTAAFFGDPDFRVTSAAEGEFTTNRCNREGLPFDVGCTNFHPDALQANLKNTWEWHAIGGVDYYMTDHFSVYVDARYVWTSGSVDIRMDHAHQVRFAVADAGQLLLAVQGKTQPDGSAPYDPNDPNTWLLWEDIGVEGNRHFHEICPACQNDGYLETEDKNMSGGLDERCENANDYCEDEGVLYKLLPGSRDVNESLKMDCPACAHNNVFDTEDVNQNGYLDRFVVYGIDICTTDRAAGNPRCKCTIDPVTKQCEFPKDNSRVTYIFPEGCPQNEIQLSPFPTLKETGCPPFPPVDPSTGKRPTLGNTGTDNAADTYIIQGGRIRLGGFALGLGFKFSF
ncbi:MAG: hypothetical protein DMF52_00755 [Acidobacteria bacterium]|nr:MAG: hypothetical protein DMF52_00755 [Acidobacteriota bacterium]